SSPGCLHRNLVVRAISESLFGRRLGRDRGARKISDGLVDRYSGRDNPHRQSGRRKPEAAERILRKEQTPARYRAVILLTLRRRPCIQDLQHNLMATSMSALTIP